MKKAMYLLIAGSLTLGACNKSNEPPAEVMGYAPIYQSDSQIAEIKSLEPQPIVTGGKIYIRGYELYQVEKGKGIHILNIENAHRPLKKAFIKIDGAEEISVMGDLLYSNNYNDLVVINIGNIYEARLVERMKDMFHLTGGNVPPEMGYFECIDPDRGSVIGWTKKMLYSPKCKY